MSIGEQSLFVVRFGGAKLVNKAFLRDISSEKCQGQILGDQSIRRVLEFTRRWYVCEFDHGPVGTGMPL